MPAITIAALTALLALSTAFPLPNLSNLTPRIPADVLTLHLTPTCSTNSHGRTLHIHDPTTLNKCINLSRHNELYRANIDVQLQGLGLARNKGSDRRGMIGSRGGL